MNHKRKSWIGISATLSFGICLLMACLLSGCMSYHDTIAHEPFTHSKNATIVITDDLGNTITFSQPVQRIICAESHTAELLVNIGAGDQIIGVTDRVMKSQPYVTDKSPNAKNIGASDIVDIETVISLRPDVMIVATFAPPGNIQQIRAANITLLYLGCYDIRDIPNSTRVLGRITGRETEAEQYLQFNEYYLSQIENRVENISEAEKSKVYLGIGNNVVYTNGSRGDYLLTFVHARNIAGNIGAPLSNIGGWITVNPEWIVAENPDIIITLSPPTGNVTTYREYFVKKEEFSSVNAVKNLRVYELPIDLTEGPRGFIGALYIAKAVYPDRFADINPEQVLQEYAIEFLPGYGPMDPFHPSLIDENT